MAEQANAPDSANSPIPQKSWFGRRLDDFILWSMRQTFKVAFGTTFKGAEVFEKIKGEPQVIVANHVSFLDGALLASTLPVRPAFAIDTEQYERFNKNPFTRFLFSRMQMFPIDSTKPQAIRDLTKLAKAGVPVMIFPEGRLTRTGSLMQIFNGAATIAENADAHIVPLHIEGLQYLKKGAPQLDDAGFPKRWLPKLSITAIEPQKLNIPEGIGLAQKKLRRLQQLRHLLENAEVEANGQGLSLIEKLHKTATLYGHNHKILSDHQQSDVTYGKILAASYALGKQFAKLSDKGENVGVILPNSVAATATFWGLQAYGRVPAMLNAKGGAGNLISCSETSALKTIITSRQVVEKAGIQSEIEELEKKFKIVYLEDIKPKIGWFAKLRAGLQSRGYFLPKSQQGKENDPALILFTSGSEGAPKGVALSSKNLLSNIAQLKSTVTFTPKDRVFNAMPLFHSFGMTGGMLLPLLSGANSYQFPSPLENKTIPKAVYFNDTTIMFGTDTFLRNYARYASDDDFQCVRIIFSGAEKLKDQTYNEYWNRFGVKIFEGYGMTEAAPGVAMNVPGKEKRGTVGTFLPKIETRLEDVPGAEGKRLYIRGPNVMLGYLKHDNPGVIQPPEDGWHDSGDIVQIDDDGFVTLAGRAKRFAKIGGEMVSLDVVEAFARAASGQTHAEHAVILKQDADKGDSIILYTTDDTLDRKKLVSAANEMKKAILGIPKDPDIHVVKEIPKLPTGKTDYQALSRLSL